VIEPHSKSEVARLEHQCNKLMVYGILKRGFALDLTKRGCKFLGEAQLPGANLYGMGYKDATRTWTGVGLRLVEDPNRVAYGELFEMPESPEVEHGSRLWHWLDSIEQNGHCYTRKIVAVKLPIVCCNECDEVVKHETEHAWVYEHTFPGCKYDEHNLIENGRF
jgi:gamma-glutamylcyclotransferase (GGCT)/AIG2-like uncharacterized protein YtfP